ncbi:MAG: AAA family ATPase [Gammaproteobacteria bacterium]
MNESLRAQYERAVHKSSPRPTEWSDIIGNARAVEQIREAITASKKNGSPLPHMLLFGPPGTGKSTLAKITSMAFGGGFFETTASTLEQPQDMIRFIWQMNLERERTSNPSVLFIDEIHQLGAAKGRLAIDQESVYPLLEDWEMPHNLIRKTVRDVKGTEYTMTTNSVLAWPFTCIGATTEPGVLSQPLLRRFLIHVELDPYTESEIAQIIQGSARRLGWTITEGAAEKLARYGRRNPGTANGLLTSANNRAVATDRDVIDEAVADEVIERLRLYPLGLTETDVRVLRLLYDRSPKGVGQAEISRAIGISLSQFACMCEPYLRLLGFVETLSRRVIRPEGISYLAQIGKIDTSKPEVRPS